ncbi:hypothetical protein HC864_05525 [Candidatus Gracilibacteria bacterium]|nr:hypothetical protein [Candidatus Gracilibacteria bacterium]
MTLIKTNHPQLQVFLHPKNLPLVGQTFGQSLELLQPLELLQDYYGTREEKTKLNHTLPKTLIATQINQADGITNQLLTNPKIFQL